MLASGQGMVIGGLIQEVDSNIQSKLPWFGDMPYVGILFQKRQVIKSRKEIIVTLRPYVLPYSPIMQDVQDDRVYRDERAAHAGRHLPLPAALRAATARHVRPLARQAPGRADAIRRHAGRTRVGAGRPDARLAERQRPLGRPGGMLPEGAMPELQEPLNPICRRRTSEPCPYG